MSFATDTAKWSEIKEEAVMSERFTSRELEMLFL